MFIFGEAEWDFFSKKKKKKNPKHKMYLFARKINIFDESSWPSSGLQGCCHWGPGSPCVPVLTRCHVGSPQAARHPGGSSTGGDARRCPPAVASRLTSFHQLFFRALERERRMTEAKCPTRLPGREEGPRGTRGEPGLRAKPNPSLCPQNVGGAGTPGLEPPS